LLGAEYRPGTGVYNPSSELSGAIIQVLDYRDKLSKEYRNRIDRLREQAPRGATVPSYSVFNPPCLIIAGDSKELTTGEQIKSFELFRQSLKDIQLITYDELFDKMSKVAELFGGTIPIPKPMEIRIETSS
jgi:hypothetical protein